MSNLLLLVHPPGGREHLTDESIEELATRLQPEEHRHRPPAVHRSPGATVVLFDPPADIQPTGASGASGASDATVWRLGSVAVADGEPFHHLEARLDGDAIAVRNDPVASRTLWYGHHDGVSVASTSLRAAVYALGSFEPDIRPLAWMLPSGILGPSWSWDARLAQLPPDAVLRLAPGGPPQVTTPPTPRPEASTAADFDRVLRDTVGTLRPTSDWVLPLSGGVDSRALLLVLPPGLRTVTWGTEASRHDPRSDTVVAAELAAIRGTRHEFLPLDRGAPPPEVVVDRFVRAAEGRIDQYSGYIDGFALWRALSDRDVVGVLRGDQMFGWRPMPNEHAARRSLGVLHFDDVETLTPYVDEVRATWALDQARLRPRGERESLDQWRDDLQRTGRAPGVLAALTQAKTGFVEVANPLLHPRLLSFVAGLPDRVRTDKRVLRRWIDEHSPPVPLATASSLADPDDLLRSPVVVERVRAALDDPWIVESVPADLRHTIATGLTSERPSAPPRRKLKRFAPRKVVRWLAYRDPRTRLSANKLGFRLLIAAEAIAMLEDDARAGAAARARSA